MKRQGSGWNGESRRHSLARKGIKTANSIREQYLEYIRNKTEPDEFFCEDCGSQLVEKDAILIDGVFKGYNCPHCGFEARGIPKNILFDGKNVVVIEEPQGWIIYRNKNGVYEELERFKKSPEDRYHKYQISTILERAKKYESGEYK